MRDAPVESHHGEKRSACRVDVDCGGGIRAALSYYAPRSEQTRHRHEYAQVSFLLAGSMHEQLLDGEYRLHTSGIGYKPPGSWHSDRWGESGALIFSLKVHPDRAQTLEAMWLPGWSVRATLTGVPGLLRLCLEGESAATRTEAVEDFLATVSARGEIRPTPRPPAWLESVRQQIVEEPELVAIEEAALGAGVHRVHLSRMFTRFYGAPPSVFRRRVLVARAVAATAGTTSTLAGIAHDAGFSDQSHMARTLRAQTGFAPSTLRALLKR